MKVCIYIYIYTSFIFVFFGYFIQNAQYLRKQSYVIIIIMALFVSFSYQHQLVVFILSLSDGKSLQVSRTLLSNLSNLNKSAVCMVSILLISASARLFPKPLGTVLSIINGFLASLTPSCSTAFLALRQDPCINLFAFF